MPLLLGLDFLIAADIIHTILEHTLEDLAQLGGIVVIRIAPSYFLFSIVGNDILRSHNFGVGFITKQWHFGMRLFAGL